MAGSALTFPRIRLSASLALVAKVRRDRWHRTATPNTGGVTAETSPGKYSIVQTVKTGQGAGR